MSVVERCQCSLSSWNQGVSWRGTGTPNMNRGGVDSYFLGNLVWKAEIFGNSAQFTYQAMSVDGIVVIFSQKTKHGIGVALYRCPSFSPKPISFPHQFLKVEWPNIFSWPQKAEGWARTPVSSVGQGSTVYCISQEKILFKMAISLKAH